MCYLSKIISTLGGSFKRESNDTVCTYVVGFRKLLLGSIATLAVAAMMNSNETVDMLTDATNSLWGKVAGSKGNTAIFVAFDAFFFI